MPDAAKSGGTARPHSDSMHGQLAVLRDQHRRQILDAHTRPSGNDDDVGVRAKGLENRLLIVANQARKVDQTAVTLDERREHRPIGVGDMKAIGVGARWQQFVAGYGQTYTRPAYHARFCLTDRTQDSQILRAQYSPRLEQHRTGDNVFAASAEILSWRDGS